MQHAGAEQVHLDASIRRKSFAAANHGTKTILENVNLRITSNELVVITGPSGCGKTTLLNIIANIDTDYEGNVKLLETQNSQVPVSYVFQNPVLLPWRTVRENLTLSIESPDEHVAELDSLLQSMGLEDVKDKFPRQISLGMARRVSLARAFAVRAPLLLMDEPFVSLDEPTAERLRDLLLSQLAGRDMAVLFVTHNLREALFLADRLVILSQEPATVVEEITLRPLGRGRNQTAIEHLRNEIISKHPEILR